MAVYTTTSSKEVIAKILLKLKLTDNTYADDILVWLAEAIDLLRVRSTLQSTHKVLKIEDYSEKLPCGLVQLDAVVYNGARLRKGLGVNDTRIQPFNKVKDASISTYFSDPDDPAYTNTQNYLLLRGDDIKLGTSTESQEYYTLYPNHIQTSFKCGEIILLYKKRPVDNEGYPLIPDEANYHRACFWFIMGELALTGYKHNDPRMDYEYCESKFDKFVKKAKGKLRYWSVDDREAIMQASVNLIPPQNYYESFSINAELPKFVNK